MSRLELTDLRYRRHVGRRKFTTLNRFRTCTALVFDQSLNSFVWQTTFLYLLIIGSSSTVDGVVNSRWFRAFKPWGPA